MSDEVPSDKLRAAQSMIDGRAVSGMILEFSREFRGVYPSHVIERFFAVGPMHSFIGLAIRNGHLHLAATPNDQ